MMYVSIQPATVSRCGMIYLEPSSLGWEPVLQSWCNTLPDELSNEHGKLIMALFHWALPVSITFVRKHCKVSASYRIHLSIIFIFCLFCCWKCWYRFLLDSLSTTSYQSGYNFMQQILRMNFYFYMSSNSFVLFGGNIYHNPQINCLKSWVWLWLFEGKSGANEQLI